MRPSRYLFTLAALFIVLFGIVLGFGSGSFSERLKPKLGLDLVGGTTMTLIARTPDCQAPSADQLEQARQIMENRVNGAGVAEPEVITEGDSHIVINVAAANEEVVEQVGTPAQLRFRTVLATASDLPAAAPTPTASATPSPGASGSAQPTTERHRSSDSHGFGGTDRGRDQRTRRIADDVAERRPHHLADI